MISPYQTLKTHGLHPRKKLGQCFLQDRNVAEKIVRVADIRPDETVVEIGAGTGILTTLLAERCQRLIAIDIDPALAAILRERLAGQPHVEIVQADILAYDLAGIRTDSASDRLKIVANIPYHVSTPILFRLISFRHLISSMVLMFQKEVADRIGASPGAKAYGIPSVLVSMFAEVSHVMDVPARCFYPVPKVVSAVVKIDMRPRPLIALRDEDFFSRLVRAAFAQRRKTLLNNLRSAGYGDHALTGLLEGLGIDGRRRGETLSPQEFGMLSNALIEAEKS